jgi:hypothetical protein
MMILVKSCARSASLQQGSRRLSTKAETSAAEGYKKRFQAASPAKFSPLTLEPVEFTNIKYGYRFKAASPGKYFPMVPKEAESYRAYLYRARDASPLARSQAATARKVASDAAFAARFAKASPSGFGPLDPALRKIKLTTTPEVVIENIKQAGSSAFTKFLIFAGGFGLGFVFQEPIQQGINEATAAAASTTESA